MYITANKLFDKLLLAKADGTYFKYIDAISRTQLFIIDDFGLKKLDSKQCTMVEPTIADAILDRLTRIIHPELNRQ